VLHGISIEKRSKTIVGHRAAIVPPCATTGAGGRSMVTKPFTWLMVFQTIEMECISIVMETISVKFQCSIADD
jgi:hypothetical protein